MHISLQFPVNPECDWPPIGSECLTFEELAEGYKSLEPPLFVTDLSVGDIIKITTDQSGYISNWQHIERSGRSVIWILRLRDTEQIHIVLKQLRDLGCNTAGIEEYGCYSVDVPGNLEIIVVDKLLNTLDPAVAAVAFPSMRHPDEVQDSK